MTDKDIVTEFYKGLSKKSIADKVFAEIDNRRKSKKQSRFEALNIVEKALLADYLRNIKWGVNYGGL